MGFYGLFSGVTGQMHWFSGGVYWTFDKICIEGLLGCGVRLQH